MSNVLDYAEAKGEARGEAKGIAKGYAKGVAETKENIMNMIEQNYTKEQILAIFNQVSEELYNEYLNEYKERKLHN